MRATAVVQLDIALDNPAEERAFFAWWAEARKLLAERARPLRLELRVAARGRYQIELATAFPGGFKLVAGDRPWIDLDARRPKGTLEARELRTWERSDIDTTTLTAWLAERAAGKRDFVLVDALPEASYQKKHIAGALSLPTASIDAERAARVLGSRDRRVVVYCGGYG